MHDRPDLFKKTVDNGKTLKKPKAKSEAKATTGCNVCGKTNHTKIKEVALQYPILQTAAYFTHVNIVSSKRQNRLYPPTGPKIVPLAYGIARPDGQTLV